MDDLEHGTLIEHGVEIDAPFEDVVDLVGDFSLLSDFHPQIASCDVDGEGVGMTRTLTLGDGSTMVERLVEDVADGYTYERVGGPHATLAYRATIRIVPREGGCTVRWTARVVVAPGGDEALVIERFSGLAEEGFASAKRFLEG